MHKKSNSQELQNMSKKKLILEVQTLKLHVASYELRAKESEELHTQKDLQVSELHQKLEKLKIEKDKDHVQMQAYLNGKDTQILRLEEKVKKDLISYSARFISSWQIYD